MADDLESNGAAEKWETLDGWHKPLSLETCRLSSSFRVKLLERQCADVLNRLIALEATVPGKNQRDFLSASIILIESHLSGELVMEDLAYIQTLWQKMLTGMLDDVMLAKDVADLLVRIAADYSSPDEDRGKVETLFLNP